MIIVPAGTRRRIRFQLQRSTVMASAFSSRHPTAMQRCYQLCKDGKNDHLLQAGKRPACMRRLSCWVVNIVD